jgi:hypothetical protein
VTPQFTHAVPEKVFGADDAVADDGAAADGVPEEDDAGDAVPVLTR